jgi:glycosyltransferase involved in cell wall biosynthesis
MKILYNLNSAGALKTGIGHYAQHLLDRILHHPEIEEVVGVQAKTILNRAALLDLSAALPPENLTFLQKFKKDLIPFLRSLPGAYRSRTILQNILARAVYKKFSKKGFIYHETNFIPMPYSGRLVVTIHDLSHIHYPEYHPKERVSYLNHYLPAVLQRADKIIAVSEFTRQEILNSFKINADKVVSVLHGVDEAFKPRKEVEIRETLNKYHLQYQGYILSVCTLEPRKNLVRVLHAFSLLPAAFRRKYPILLVGMKGWKNKKLLSLAEPLLKAGELILLGYVKQEELYHIYSGAKFLE